MHIFIDRKNTENKNILKIKEWKAMDNVDLCFVINQMRFVNRLF